MATARRPVRKPAARSKYATTTAYATTAALDTDRLLTNEGGHEQFERDGALQCTCVDFLDKEWCNHVQWVVTTSHDAMPKGPDSAHVEFVKYPDNMLIPMFPTKGVRDAAFQTVWLGPIEQDGSREVRMVTQWRMAEPTELLGWIFPGEGRNVIRQMIIEWVRAKYRTASACTSPVHKDFAWSKGDDRTQPLSERNLADLYLLLKTNECLSCHQFSDMSADAPDL
jgi:hypothetical protein